MCRLVGWVSRTPLTARQVLGEDGLAALRRLSLLHGDGWGTSVEGEDGPVVQRSTTRAADDPAFAAATDRQASRLGIVHLRWATPGLPVQPTNTHPFSCGSTAFAHNGAFGPVDRLGELLEEPWRDRLQGTTDSEHYYLAMLAELARGANVPTAVDRVTTRLAHEFTTSSLNALLQTPDALHAVNCHDAASFPGASPPQLDEEGQALLDDHGPYFDLRYRVREDSVTVVSSGIVAPEADGWQVVPQDHVLVVDRATLAVEQVPLGAGLSRRHALPASS